MTKPLHHFLQTALSEDIREGDHTTLATVPENKKGIAELVLKEKGIVAGVNVAEQIFHYIDPNLELEFFLNDGSPAEAGKIAFIVKGSLRSILTAERLALNVMQRMSGIATLTRQFVKAIEGYSAKILDTRKTTPGIRFLEKEAVKIGGGENHRFGLYDMIMIKDNHIDACGGIKEAIERVQEYLNNNNLSLKVEIETRNIKEVREVLNTGQVNRIMLDNFSFSEMQEAVKLINKKFETEASGGITLETIRRYAATGVDYISVGALTHSAKALDMSLKVKNA